MGMVGVLYGSGLGDKVGVDFLLDGTFQCIKVLKKLFIKLKRK
jgi:hypothetical protein